MAMWREINPFLPPVCALKTAPLLKAPLLGKAGASVGSVEGGPVISFGLSQETAAISLSIDPLRSHRTVRRNRGGLSSRAVCRFLFLSSAESQFHNSAFLFQLTIHVIQMPGDIQIPSPAACNSKCASTEA